MLLEEIHNLHIENRGNRFVGQLRPAKRLVRLLASKLAALVAPVITKTHLIGTRLSCAYIEDRMLRAALDVDFNCGRHNHSNKK